MTSTRLFSLSMSFRQSATTEKSLYSYCLRSLTAYRDDKYAIVFAVNVISTECNNGEISVFILLEIPHCVSG